MTMNKPRRLKKGDLVAITAPSGAIRDLETVPRYKRFFEERGYHVIVGQNCLTHTGYLSADDRTRADEINAFFRNDEVKAIFCARGGYGAARMLQYLDYEQIKKNPKVFFGFSDVTAIHTALNRYASLVTFHGPNGNVSSGKPFCDESAQKMFSAVTGNEPIILSAFSEQKAQCLRGGIASGISCGGNLSLVAHSLGTAYEPEFDGRILFLEDVNEEPYAIDRMLTHLKQYGVFRRVSGVVFGYFTHCVNPNPEYGFDLRQSMLEAVAETDIPVMADMPFGHEHPTLTIPMGMQCVLDANRETVIFDGPATEV